MEANKMEKQYWYEVSDLVYPSGKRLNQKQMIQYAKKNLSINKRVHGLDKEVMAKDLDKPINAWVYLKNIGIGRKTNRKRF